MLLFLSAIAGMKAVGQVSSLIPGLAANHCSQTVGSAESDILACQVWDGRPELFSSPRQIEIYRKGKRVRSIDPGAVIIEWHLWKGGRQLAVHVRDRGSYALYDTATGSVLDKCPEKATLSQLPEWAKSESEQTDEAVPKGPAYTQERTQWIAKLLRELQAIHPGMQRSDLQLLLRSEGGLSTRYERTYVSVECPYIKLDVRFRPKTKDAKSFEEQPDDLIESVSKPYLDWSIMD